VSKRKQRKKSRFRLKIAILLSLSFIWAVVGFFKYINNPNIQAMIFASINNISSLKIESAAVDISIRNRTINISGIRLHNPSKKQTFRADRASLTFNILPIFKGGLSIRNLSIKNLQIEIDRPEVELPRKKPKISLTNLLLLRNLTIRHAVIDGIQVKTLTSLNTATSATFHFVPSLWGDVTLTLGIEDIRMETQNKRPITIASFMVRGRTDPGDWIDIFPYVDNLSGSVALSHFQWHRLDVESFTAKLRYSGRRAAIHSADITVNERTLHLDGRVDGVSGRYGLNIEIPEPIYLPPLGRDTSFLDTSGYIGGKIEITGTGLDYKTTKAKIHLDLNHSLEKKEQLPTYLVGDLNIGNGQVNIDQARLTVGDNTVSVGGSMNYVHPNMQLNFKGENISIETVMNRFNNKHYHPTKGTANVTGEFRGWKPNLEFRLKVETKNATYYDIKGGHVTMDLNMTYNHLGLTGAIFQEGHKVGAADLQMKMGGMRSDGTRQKSFKLTASVNNIDLLPTMSAYNLTGMGNAHMTLEGSPERYTGSGEGTITNGSFKKIGFLDAKSSVQFSTKKLVFGNIYIATSETNPATFSAPVTMDVTDYGIRLHGEPRHGFSIDAKYYSNNGRWQIDKISYSSLDHIDWVSTLRGSVSETGALNLKLAGTLDTSLLSNLRGFVREAQGPADIPGLQIGGTTENPTFSGHIELNKNILQLRGWGYYIDRIRGTIDFHGHTISTKKLRGRIEYGDFNLSGSVTHANRSIHHTDISFDAKSISYATADKAFRMEFDCDIQLKGGPNNSLLSGTLNVLDGRYTKHFSIFEKMKKGMEYIEPAATEVAWKNMRLDLKVKDRGDLKIDNNIGEIWLRANLDITGFKRKPNITGNIETVGGEVHYAGLDFEVTRGHMEFRDPYNNPFLEFVATKEVGNYNVTLTVRGRIDKLFLDLESTPPLDKNDILALLSFGVTPDQLEEARFGLQLGTGLVAEQVGAILQRPVTKFTPLDRFRIEAAPRTSGANVTRLYMGKDISDRLRINFITDINTEDAQQTIQAEYLLTDFLLLKGEQMSNANYRFHLSFRFREQ